MSRKKKAGRPVAAPIGAPCAARVVPEPADPHKRYEKLPWERPKSTADDPLAAERVRRILESPSYSPADQDMAFLDRDVTRGPRLELYYLKPEVLLQQHGIDMRRPALPMPDATEQRDRPRERRESRHHSGSRRQRLDRHE